MTGNNINENSRALSNVRILKKLCNVLGFGVSGLAFIGIVVYWGIELIKSTFFIEGWDYISNPLVYNIVLILITVAFLIARHFIFAALSRREIKYISAESIDVKDDEVLLKVDHLSQHFGPNKAVDDVSFEVKKGEVFGLVGESGCGKTTTGRTIIKLYDATGGDVYFKGQKICAGTYSYKKDIADAKAKAKKDIAALKLDSKANPANKQENDKAIRQIKTELAHTVSDNRIKIDEAKVVSKFVDRKTITQIQMIFQDPVASLDPRMTVRDIIAEGLIINGMRDKKKINEMVYEILEKVGLVREHADRYPHEFSGGQKQRIGIARAVVMNPEMIIADEPVSALDVSIQAQVINLLNELKDSMGLTILFIAHDLSVVKYFSDRIGVMYFGKMVELADSDELFKNPMHPYTKSLLSAIPLPDPIYEKQRVRVNYNPLADHDYSVDKPSFREISPGHFVLCNDKEELEYKQMLNKETEG